MESIGCDGGAYHAGKVDATCSPWEDIVSGNQQSPKVLRVYRIPFITGTYQVVGDFRCLPPISQFYTVAAFSDKIVVYG